MPHFEQKRRSTAFDERNVLGLPLTNLNLPFSNVTQATTGAPATPRHVRQWQTIELDGGTSARYRTAPQKQPPETFDNLRISAIHRRDV